MYNNYIHDHHKELNKIYNNNCTSQVIDPPTEDEIDTLLSKTNFYRPYAVRVITAYKNWLNKSNNNN